VLCYELRSIKNLIHVFMLKDELDKNKREKIWISPKAMEKRLYINLECIYNSDIWEVMDLDVILCAWLKDYVGRTYGNVNIWLLLKL
jgi:hypothetical protein